MRRLHHWLILWFLLGEQYFVIEAVYRLFRGERAHVAMLAVGGLCAVLIGVINQVPRLYKLPVAVQSLIGTAMTLAVEFLSGYILNIRMGLAIWDYSHLPSNLMGQVCVQFGLIWLFIMPFAVWLEDFSRWKLWGEGEPYSLGSIYIDFITGK